jgi:hypothetical protein
MTGTGGTAGAGGTVAAGQVAGAGGAAGMGELVGRHRELTAIERVIDAAAAGNGGVLLLRGPGGIGKSRLLRAVEVLARERGCTVLGARGWEGPGVPAFWLWTQVARAIASETDLDRLDGGDALQALVAAPGEGVGPRDTFGVLDALARTHAALARDHPVVVLLDDLHWADLTSLEATVFVAEQLRGHPIAIIGAYRALEVSQSERAGIVARLEHESEVATMSGLTRAELGELLEADGFTGDEDAVAALHDATGGNPFFAIELARFVQQRGPTAALPTSVRAAVDGHLQLLAPATVPVLTVAALQGRDFADDVLARALRAPMSVVQDALDDAHRVGLVEPTATGSRFVHALMAQVLTERLDTAERERLHLAIADAITALYGRGGMDEVICEHVVAASDLVGTERLVDAGRAAARRALERLAPADAARHLGATVDALRGSSDDVGTEIAELQLERCRALKAAGRSDDAFAAGSETADLARARGDWELFARAALEVPPDLEGVEVDDIARSEQTALREEALARAPRDDAGLVARLMAALAMSLYWEQATGDRARDHLATGARRDELTAQALELARTKADLETTGYCLAARLQALWGPDAARDHSERVEELMAIADELGDADLAMRARTWHVVELLETREFGDAQRAIDEFERRAEVLRSPLYRWTAARWQATMALLHGDLAAAEDRAASAVELGTIVVGGDAAFTFFGTTLALVRYFQCRMSELETTLRELTAQYPNIPAWRSGLAVVAAEQGDVATAAEQLEWLAADGFAVLPRDLYWLSGIAVLGPAILAVGDARIARVTAELLTPFSGRYVLQGNGYSTYGPVDRVLAMCSIVMDDLDTAARLLRGAVEQTASARDPFHPLCRYELGRVLIAAGSVDEGRLELTGAAGELRAIGLEELARRAEDPPRLRTPTTPRGAFRLESDHWLIRRPGGVPILLPDRRGLAYLHALLRVGEASALDLVGVSEPEGTESAGVRRALATQTVDESVDARALDEYRRRVVELDDALARADAAGDARTSATLSSERDALLAELRRVTRRDGTPRRASPATERARVNVTKHLRRAIDEIAERDPELGRHFATSVQTGARCSYRPAQGETIDWTG